MKATCSHGHTLHTVRGQIPAHDTEGRKLPTKPWQPLTATQEKSVRMRHRTRNARQRGEARTRCRA